MIDREVLYTNIVEPITVMTLPERARSQAVREALASENYDPQAVVAENREVLGQLSETPFRNIGQKLVKGDALTFNEAFIGMTYVVAATNRGIFRELQPALQKAHGLPHITQNRLDGPGQTFLTCMAQREAHSMLTAEEVAGMVAAGMMDINIRIGFEPYVLETGGMGGDKGFIVNGEKKKVINASTLSAVVLSSIGTPVVKHGSYANTSAVGSTEAIEALGMNIYQQSFAEIQRLFEQTRFYFSDAHIAKTIHDLSHSPFMRHETINHIIGPMTPPVDRQTRLHKVIGVNEGVHPNLIAKAYEILHEKGYQNIGNVVAVSGLSQEFDTADIDDIEAPEQMKPYMMLDEVSPYATLLSIVQRGKYIGSFTVRPEDFGVHIDPNAIQFVNTQEELLVANGQALQGISDANSDYLAMNAAIGLFATKYLDREDAIVEGKLNTAYLQECFVQCRDTIVSGQAAAHLKKIVNVSNNKAETRGKEYMKLFKDVDLAVFDIDNVLVHPHDPDFYRQYSEAVNRAVTKYLSVSPERGKEVADFFRKEYGGGERAFFAGMTEKHFPEFGSKEEDFSLMYKEMCAIDPSGQFKKIPEILEMLKTIREKGIKIVGLTDSPKALSQRILKESGIDPSEIFDLYVAYDPKVGPSKMVFGDKIFKALARYFQVAPDRVITIGDTYATDIEPAAISGMKTCIISKKHIEGYNGYQSQTIKDFLEGQVTSNG